MPKRVCKEFAECLVECKCFNKENAMIFKTILLLFVATQLVMLSEIFHELHQIRNQVLWGYVDY